jgi:hypothetical protein
MQSTPGVLVDTCDVNAYTLPVVVRAHPPDLLPAMYPLNREYAAPEVWVGLKPGHRVPVVRRRQLRATYPLWWWKMLST